jgi:hypothetical protein
LLEELDELFNTHLNIVKDIFCTLKNMGVVEQMDTKVLSVHPP